MEIGEFYCQELVRAKQLELGKILGTINPANVLTKHVPAAELKSQLENIGMINLDEFPELRAQLDTAEALRIAATMTAEEVNASDRVPKLAGHKHKSDLSLTTPWKPKLATSVTALQVVAASCLLTTCKAQDSDEDSPGASGSSSALMWILASILVVYAAYKLMKELLIDAVWAYNCSRNLLRDFFPDAEPETEADPMIAITMSQEHSHVPHLDLISDISETADHLAASAAGESQSSASAPEAAQDQGGGRASSSSNASVELSPTALPEPTAPVASATENATIGLTLFPNRRPNAQQALRHPVNSDAVAGHRPASSATSHTSGDAHSEIATMMPVMASVPVVRFRTGNGRGKSGNPDNPSSSSASSTQLNVTSAVTRAQRIQHAAERILSEATVFYSNNGLQTGVFHSVANCGYLQVSRNIMRRTLSWSIQRQHRPCEACRTNTVSRLIQEYNTYLELADTLDQPG
jgi:hypothetical protein